MKMKLIFPSIACLFVAASSLDCDEAYGRTGHGLDSCPNSHPDKDGLLCYPNCEKGYSDDGVALCWEDCDGDIVGPLCVERPLKIRGKDMYSRGVGVIPKDCNAGDVNIAGFCHKPCNSGYNYCGFGNCCKDCKSGYEYHSWSNTCFKHVFDFYNAGVTKYANPTGLGYIPTACPSGKENIAGLCYTKCKSGYKSDIYGMFGLIDLTLCWEQCSGDEIDDGKTCRITEQSHFRKSYGRGAGKPLQCADDEEQQDLTCYPKCRDGFVSDGQGCFANQQTCGTTPTKPPTIWAPTLQPTQKPSTAPTRKESAIDWVRITKRDIGLEVSSNTDMNIYNDADGHLVVEGTLQARGCGSGDMINFGVSLADGKTWNKIRYTMEFVSGASSCWSILGNEQYSAHQPIVYEWPSCVGHGCLVNNGNCPHEGFLGQSNCHQIEGAVYNVGDNKCYLALDGCMGCLLEKYRDVRTDSLQRIDCGMKKIPVEYGLFGLDVIENGLSYGQWDGETRRCDNEEDNFLHAKHGIGYKGFLTVEQTRDTSVDQAAIGSGFSCTKVPSVVRYKDIFIGYYKDEDEYDDLIGTWDWCHNGLNRNGDITIEDDGTVSSSRADWTGQHWDAEDEVMFIKFNDLDHTMVWGDDEHESLILVEPQRTPPSVAVKRIGGEVNMEC